MAFRTDGEGERQFFVLFNANTREYIVLPSLKEWFTKGINLTRHLIPPAPAWQALSLLKNPLEGVQIERQSGINDADKSTFCRLPVEVHEMVFAEIDDYYDTCALALTSTYFWSTSVPYLRARYKEHYYTNTLDWGGHRLACIGSQSSEIPRDFLSEWEEMLFEQAREDRYFSGPGRNQKYVLCDEEDTFFNDMIHDFSDTSLLASEPYCWPPFKAEFERASHHKYPGVFDWLRSPQGLHNYSQSEEAGPPYVLRNHTKRLYVRADILADNPSDVKGPFIRHLDFGDLIISKICWTDSHEGIDFGYARKNGHEMLEGDWSGDRFDIVPLDSFKTMGWKDVSKEARSSLIEMWSHEFGPEWRVHVDRWKSAY